MGTNFKLEARDNNGEVVAAFYSSFEECIEMLKRNNSIYTDVYGHQYPLVMHEKHNKGGLYIAYITNNGEQTVYEGAWEECVMFAQAHNWSLGLCKEINIKKQTTKGIGGCVC